MALRIAVVGGRGWLGREIAGAAAARGHVVTIVSRRPVGRRPDRLPGAGPRAVDRSGPAGAGDRVGLVPVDLADTTELGGVLGSYDVVVNAAGCRSGKPDVLAAANAVLPDRLGALAADAGWRLVHLGSAAEYGRGAAGPDPIPEDRPCRPETAYARTKLAGTEAVARWRDRGARATVARVFNVVGADLPAHNPAHGLALQARALLAGDGQLAVGDPTTERDLCSLTWVAEAVVALALRQETPVPAPAVGAPVGAGRGGDAATRARVRWAHGGTGPTPDAVPGPPGVPGDPGTGPPAAGVGGPAPAVVNVCSGRGTSFGELALALAAELGVDARIRDLGWPRGGRIVGDPAVLRSLVALPDPPSVRAMARAALGGPADGDGGRPPAGPRATTATGTGATGAPTATGTGPGARRASPAAHSTADDQRGGPR